MAREMKDSGFVWLGQIPHDWEIRKLKHYYTLKTGFTPDTKKQEYYDETGYDWVNISDLSDGATIYETRKKISQAYVDAFSPEQIPAGSLMYSFKLSVGQTSFAGKPLFTNEAIASFLASETVDLHYLRYSSSFIIENAQTNIYNAKILNQDLINNAYVPFPPLAEQARIAVFLDRKCAEIDSVIADTQRTIEEYKKLKQTIITEAVTKGIRGERPMKDSGIEWIGEIPEEWYCTVLKRFCKFQTGGTPSTANQDWFDGDVDWFTPGDFSDNYLLSNSSRKLSEKAITDKAAVVIPENTVLIIGIGGTAGKIGITTQMCSCNQQITALLQDEHIFSRYLMYWMIANTKFLKETALFTTLPIINNQTIGEYVIVLPNTIEEQQEIAAYLDEKCIEIDCLIQAKQNLLVELESYKKSVIYEYVTGKKEVPACQ